VFAELIGWPELMAAAGWEAVGSDGAGDLYLRPGGASSKFSARVLFSMPHVIVNHSDNATCPDGTALPAGPGNKLTKGRFFAYWWGYRGNTSDATLALLAGENRAGIPDDILTQIQRAGGQFHDPLGVLWAAQSPTAGQPTPPLALEPVTPEMWEAFLDTFTRATDVQGRAAGRRRGWLSEDLMLRPGERLGTFRRHAVATFTDVIGGRFTAAQAVALLTDGAPPEVTDVSGELRAVLAVVLASKRKAA
jgi:hypothetical protein